MKRLIHSILFFMLSSTLVKAGTGYYLYCSNKRCGSTFQVSFGGGIRFCQTQGFCSKCDQFVVSKWTSEKNETPPVPFLRFWDPTTGSLRNIFHCPRCSGEFIELRNVSELKFCPKCKKPSLKIDNRTDKNGMPRVLNPFEYD